MTNRLKDKVAIITGSSVGGTGHGIAVSFLREGAKVVVTDIDEGALATSLADLKHYGEVVGLVADVSRRVDADRVVATAAERFGRLDVLVNNAAVSTPGVMLQDLDEASIESQLGVSLYGTIYHMQAAFPLLKRQGGSVINFGSRNGVIGAAGFSMYAAAKEGVRGMSRAAAREWGQYGIRVNVLCPATLSPGAKIFLDTHPAEAEKVRETVAMGYIGDAVQDVAPIAVFLASDEGHYITGQTINVDGGQVML